MPFLEVQQFFDEDYPKWERRYSDAELRDRTGRRAHRRARTADETMPSHHSNIDVWQGGGAPARLPADATAIGDRSSAFMLGIEANWDFVPSDAQAGEQERIDATNIEWARSGVAAAAPWATGARYANFPGLFEEKERPDFFGPQRSTCRGAEGGIRPREPLRRNQAPLTPPSVAHRPPRARLPRRRRPSVPVFAGDGAAGTDSRWPSSPRSLPKLVVSGGHSAGFEVMCNEVAGRIGASEPSSRARATRSSSPAHRSTRRCSRSAGRRIVTTERALLDPQAALRPDGRLGSRTA